MTKEHKQYLLEKRFIYMNAIMEMIAKGANDYKIELAFKMLADVEKQLEGVEIK